MKTVKILWADDAVNGTIQIKNGSVRQAAADSGCAQISFDLKNQQPLVITVDEQPDRCGSQMTQLLIDSSRGSFTVRVMDINSKWPVWLPAMQIVVTTGEDRRTYDQIVMAIQSNNLLPELARISREPEETYENAAQENISLHGPAWLGLGQDMRIFSADLRSQEDDYWAWVEPRLAGKPIELPEVNGERIRYQYIMGRGIGCVHDYDRRLERGYLPILIETISDKSITYETKVFVSLERSPFIEAHNPGTDYLVADRFGAGAYQTDAQKTEADQRWQAWQAAEREETVAYLQTTITNSDPVPRYAWYKAPRPAYVGDAKTRRVPIACSFAPGFGRFSTDSVFCTVKLNDRPLTQEEIAILVKPGETIRIDVTIPHRPVSEARAQALLQQDLSRRLQECIDYWEQRRSQAARIEIPEKPVHEMIQAGQIHLDIATYGSQPSGTLTPTIGVYSALGSESWPIILYYDSIGLHDKARRCIQYFYDKQHENGFMRNFGSYSLETGAVLWVTAEHDAYTQDEAWLMSLMPGIRRACNYLLAWRERNKRPELRGKGYGMLEGRSSDTPDDESRMYLLNAYTYKGLAEIARVCLSLDPDYWQPVLDEIALYRQDIRDSLISNLPKGPVVPLSNGTWCPTCAPWADGNGPVSLYSDSHNWYTHGSFVTRDSHMNTLTFCGILDPDETLADLFMQYHCELFFHKNVRPSQPYYARHPYLHLLRGEAKAFIKNYYNALTSLADRETYSFWEHYFHASPHKTHEEGCFLMESRWMLYLESGDSLRLLQGIPSVWLTSGQSIRLTNAASYFGHFTLAVTSDLTQPIIKADILFHNPDRMPASVVIRLPHPEAKAAQAIAGGTTGERPEEYQIAVSQGQGSLVVRY